MTDAERRRDEAERILDWIEDQPEILSDSDAEFVDDLNHRRDLYGLTFKVSERQLEWLQDIEDKLRRRD